VVRAVASAKPAVVMAMYWPIFPPFRAFSIGLPCVCSL
jgi:hypothetical protein